MAAEATAADSSAQEKLGIVPPLVGAIFLIGMVLGVAIASGASPVSADPGIPAKQRWLDDERGGESADDRKKSSLATPRRESAPPAAAPPASGKTG